MQQIWRENSGCRYFNHRTTNPFFATSVDSRIITTTQDCVSPSPLTTPATVPTTMPPANQANATWQVIAGNHTNDLPFSFIHSNFNVPQADTAYLHAPYTKYWLFSSNTWSSTNWCRMYLLYSLCLRKFTSYFRQLLGLMQTCWDGISRRALRTSKLCPPDSAWLYFLMVFTAILCL